MSKKNQKQVQFKNNDIQEQLIEDDYADTFDLQNNIILNIDKIDKMFLENGYLKNQTVFDDKSCQEQDMINQCQRILEVLQQDVYNKMNKETDNQEKKMRIVLNDITDYQQQAENLELSEQKFQLFLSNLAKKSEQKIEQQKEDLELRRKNNNELKYYSFKKKMQLEYQKKKQLKQNFVKKSNKQNVYQRLMGGNQGNLKSNSYQKIEDLCLDLQNEQNQKLYTDLKKAKNQTTQIKLIQEYWKNYIKSYEENIKNIRNGEFYDKYKKRNHNLNLFMAKLINNQKNNTDLKKKEVQIDHFKDEQIETIKEISKNLLEGNLYEIWRQYKFERYHNQI